MKWCFKYFVLLLTLLWAGENYAQGKKNKLNEKEQRLAELYFTEAEKYFVLEDYAKAYMLFNKVLDLYPDNATVHYKIADVAVKGEDYDKAIYHADQAIALDPHNKYFYLLAIDLYTKQANFKEAARLYEKMIATIPGTEQYYYDLAAIYIFQEDFEKALDTYDQAENVFGINEKITTQKQKIYLKQNKLDKAIDESRKLIEAYLWEPSHVIELAKILSSNGRPHQARQELEKLIEKFPDNSEARIQLANVYLNDNEFEKADDQFIRIFGDPELDLKAKIEVLSNYISKFPDERAINVASTLAEELEKAHPEDAATFTIYGDMLLALDKKTEALEKYKQSISLDESNFAVWQNVLDIQLRLNKFDGVITYAEQAMEIYPNQGAIYYFGGFAHLRKKNYEEAIWLLEQGRKLIVSNAELENIFNSLLGDAYHAVKEYKKSDNAYERVLENNPENWGVLNNYSYYLSLRGEKLELAREMSGKLIENNPDNPTFLDTHAWVLYQMGKYKDARKIMERALELKGVDGIHYEHYGDILYKLGDVDGAVENWQKAKGLDAGLENIDKKIADRKLYE